MAGYTPEFLASLRHRYEQTEQSMPSLAKDFEIGLRTLHRMVEREGWKKRSELPPRELPAPIRLLDEANALLSAKETEPSLPSPRERQRVVGRVGAQGAGVGGLSPPNEVPPTPDPSTPLGSASRGEGNATLSAAERIERLVLKEIEVEEAKRAQLGALPRAAAEAAATARTLAILTHTLHALQRLRLGQPGARYDDHDDMPRDIDEFRRELARRIDAFVASRTDARNAEGSGEPRVVGETR